jgi:hypothetical protein
MTVYATGKLRTSIHGVFRQQTRNSAGKNGGKPASYSSPKAEARGSNPFGCANKSITYETLTRPKSGRRVSYVSATISMRVER